MTADNPAPTPRKRSAAPPGTPSKRPVEGQGPKAAKPAARPASKPASEPSPKKSPAPLDPVDDLPLDQAPRPTTHRRRSRNSLLATLAGVLIGFAGVGVGLGVWYASQSAQQTKGGGRRQAAQDSDHEPEAAKNSPTKRRSVQVRVHTPEPGFLLLVDGLPVRAEGGELLTTPCEVTVERGQHTYTVAKTGWRQAVEIANSLDSGDLDIDSVFEPFAGSSGFVTGAWLNLETDKPTPLTAFEDQGRFHDPFVSADGLTLWVAGEGNDGRGLYESTRTSPFDDFGPPRFIVLSRGSERPFSPSATSDGNLLAYCFKNRVLGLRRAAGDDEYNDKPLLKRSPHEEATCLAAWLSPDGKRLYWNEEHKGAATGYFVSRKELGGDFGRSHKFALPGATPNLSADELRQYTFDGKDLRCFERKSIEGEFRDSRVVAKLELPDYRASEGQRQFCVSDDEQWMFYAADPDSAGKLFVVRLSETPQRGDAPVGKPIEPKKPAKTAETPEMVAEKPTAPKPAAPTEPAVDPRTLPLPYAAFRDKFASLLKERKVAAAAEWLDARRAAPELAANTEALGWDAADLQHIERFWSAADEGAASLKAGEPLRISGVSVEVQSYADGTLTARTKSNQIEKKLVELNHSDVVALAERKLDKSAADDQLAIGTFLYYESAGPSAAGNTRLQKAGPAGAEFLDRQGRRVVQLIEQEFGRDNVAAALKWIEEAQRAAPKTPSAEKAAEFQEKIYTFVKWTPVGPRDWKATAEGEYTAVPGKRPGSLLLSPHEYGNFELSLEWKTTASTGQGGVYFRYPGKGKPMETAFKIHLANDPGVSPDKFSTGSLFNVAAPKANPTKAGGAWNTLQMNVQGEQIRVTINGEKVLETTASNEEIPSTGFVALDGELGGIVFRKILLIETPGK